MALADDIKFMKQALALAAKGRGYTAPNPMVGAIVVRDGQVVGRGYHEAVGGAHAEVNAIDDAAPNARGATLYVTLEPCNHTGRTPPCTQKILSAGIGRVVSAMADPNPSVTGGGNRFLSSRGIDVDCGVCRDDAQVLNEMYITFVRTGKPFVIAKCAATLDGRLATRTGDSKWITGPAARQFVHRLRHEVDAIMVGVNTIKTDDPQLTTRLPIGKGRDPKRIILDTRLTIAEDARVLRLESDSDTIVVSGPNVAQAKKDRLIESGIQVLNSPVKDDKIDLNELVKTLGAAGVTSLLVEGGGHVLASAFTAGIVDKVYFFYGPKILGGDDGVPICSGPGPALMKDAVSITDIALHRFADDVMIEGYLKKTCLQAS
ncbi:MAG: bifunctional diaminohydroxyphosphoribosylaminopyrimidine deaminase/5-amino-6-(5-phosphoribosylamino)uracil reductase RibD [Deltaproteobacteria bacterium]|nr:bifunctional diaminohydroxyphosphoribosylaminopyrimidine deaminase/5-amino-6-(5-phosphoribosylamino)uracil reductase RibD [Deltaproteobacteria bacterium]